jgi:hypothetical protein
MKMRRISHHKIIYYNGRERQYFVDPHSKTALHGIEFFEPKEPEPDSYEATSVFIGRFISDATTYEGLMKDSADGFYL